MSTFTAICLSSDRLLSTNSSRVCPRSRRLESSIHGRVSLDRTRTKHQIQTLLSLHSYQLINYYGPYGIAYWRNGTLRTRKIWLLRARRPNQQSRSYRQGRLAAWLFELEVPSLQRVNNIGDGRFKSGISANRQPRCRRPGLSCRIYNMPEGLVCCKEVLGLASQAEAWLSD